MIPDRLGPSRRLGLLEQLSMRQESYRALVQELRSMEDRSFREAVSAGEGIDEESMVALATVKYEMDHRDDENYESDDILWAGEVIDHLDTIGFEVRRKLDADTDG